MSLDDWVPLTTGDLTFSVAPGASFTRPDQDCLLAEGTTGTGYLVPKAEHGMRGQVAGVMRTGFQKMFLAPDGEVRIYCMLSAEDIRTEGQCYAFAVNNAAEAFLLKYHDGLAQDPVVLQHVRLSFNPAIVYLGLLWVHDTGVFRDSTYLEGLMGTDVGNPGKQTKIFQYHDVRDPLLTSTAEGIGVRIADEALTQVMVDTTTLHRVKYKKGN